jgi:hypothetical protein
MSATAPKNRPPRAFGSAAGNEVWIIKANPKLGAVEKASRQCRAI